MKANVIWHEKMTFTGKTNSDHPILLGTPSSPDHATPMELILIGLAGCTAMDVISILEKKRQQVTRFEIQVDADRSENHPKIFKDVVLTYIFAGKDIEENAVLRAIGLSTTKYCSVHAMLEQSVHMDLRYEIYEDGGDGSQKLTYQGVWKETTPE